MPHTKIIVGSSGGDGGVIVVVIVVVAAAAAISIFIVIIVISFLCVFSLIFFPVVSVNYWQIILTYTTTSVIMCYFLADINNLVLTAQTTYTSSFLPS